MTRYAVYAIPGALGETDVPGAARLYDTVERWYACEQFRDLTVNPRRYGFHATLKPPFQLADGSTEEDLRDAASTFAAIHAPVLLQALTPRSIGAFRALVPQGDQHCVQEFAEAAVRDFEPFRAPLTEAEVARRRPEQLTAAQRNLLDTWGYPYVLDEFRFHFTLTDPVPEERSAAVDCAINAHFAEITGLDVVVRSIALVVEPEPGADFQIHSVHPLTPREVV